MTIKLVDLFSTIDVNDDDAVTNIIDNFSFGSKSAQAEAINQLREDLGFKYSQIHTMLRVSNMAYSRLVRGEVDIRPPQLRLLLMMLLIREVNPELFERLCHCPTPDDVKPRIARFNVRK